MIPAVTGAVKGFAWTLPLLPLAVTAGLLHARVPGVQQQAGDILGFGATLCLLACLAVTPVAVVTGWRGAARWRQAFGLWMFTLGFAGLVIAATTGIAGCTGTAQQWTGTLIVVLLIPAVVTSNHVAQRWLGAYWKTWQRRLTWAAWGVLAAHLLLLAPVVAGVYLAASAPLVAARLPGARKSLSRFRRTRLRQPRWMRAAVPAGLAVFAAGFGVLAWMEVAACAHAV